MKINAIGKQNIYLSNYKVNTKQVTFGHYLDDEKYYKEQRLSNLYSEISDVNSRIWDDNYDFDSETSSLNDGHISFIASINFSLNLTASSLS